MINCLNFITLLTAVVCLSQSKLIKSLISEHLKIYKDRNEFLESKLSHLNLAVKAYEENMINKAALVEFVTDLERSSGPINKIRTFKESDKNKDLVYFLSKYTNSEGEKYYFDFTNSRMEKQFVTDNKNPDAVTKSSSSYSGGKKQERIKLVTKLLTVFNSSSEPGISLNKASLLLINSKNRLTELKKLYSGSGNMYTHDMKLTKFYSKIQVIENNFDAEVHNFFIKLANKYYSRVKKLSDNIKTYFCANINDYCNNFNTDYNCKDWCSGRKEFNEFKVSKNKHDVQKDHKVKDDKEKSNRDVNDRDLYKNNKDAIGKRKTDNLKNKHYEQGGNNIKRDDKYSETDSGFKSKVSSFRSTLHDNYNDLYKTDGDTIGKSKINNLENDSKKYSEMFITSDDLQKNDEKKTYNLPNEEKSKNFSSVEIETEPSVKENNDNKKHNLKDSNFEKFRTVSDSYNNFKNPTIKSKERNEFPNIQYDGKLYLKDQMRYMELKKKENSRLGGKNFKSREDLRKNSDKVVKHNFYDRKSSVEKKHEKNDVYSSSKNNKYKNENSNKKYYEKNHINKKERDFDLKKKLNDNILNKKIDKSKNGHTHDKRNRYRENISLDEVSQFKEDVLNSIYNYIDDLLIDFKTGDYYGDEKNSFFNASEVAGDWFLNLGYKRSEIRAEKRKSDWLFDRAEGRHSLRDTKDEDSVNSLYKQTLWYFRRAWERNRFRY